MRGTRFGRTLALLCLSSSFSSAVAQAHHEYVQPNPQRYQHAPVPNQLPSYAPEPDPQQPASSEPAPQRRVAQDSLAPDSNQVLAFIQEHMVAIFLGMLLLAPLGAMLAMRKTNHPYDH